MSFFLVQKLIDTFHTLSWAGESSEKQELSSKLPDFKDVIRQEFNRAFYQFQFFSKFLQENHPNYVKLLYLGRYKEEDEEIP